MSALHDFIDLDRATPEQIAFATAVYTEARAAARIDRLATMLEIAGRHPRPRVRAYLTRELARYNAVWTTARAQQAAMGHEPFAFWWPVKATPDMDAEIAAEAAADARWEAQA